MSAIRNFDAWWSQSGYERQFQNPDRFYKEVATAAWNAGRESVLATDDLPIAHQLAIAILEDDELALHVLFDRLIDDGVLAPDYRVETTVKDLPRPGSRWRFNGDGGQIIQVTQVSWSDYNVLCSQGPMVGFTRCDASGKPVNKFLIDLMGLGRLLRHFTRLEVGDGG